MLESDPKWAGVIVSFVSMIWWTATQFSNTKKDIEVLNKDMGRIEGALDKILEELKQEAVMNSSLREDIVRLQEQIKGHQLALLRSQRPRDEK